MHIGIYSDPDSMTSIYGLKESLFEVLGPRITIKEYCKENIRQLKANNTNIFIVPGIGGEVCHYYEHLGGRNAAYLQDYTRNGGTYLGLCAGGFYAMTHIRYTTEDGTVKKRQSPFGMIPGLGYGPVAGKDLMTKEEGLRGYCAVRPLTVFNTFNQKAFNGRMLYSSGPTFRFDGGDAKVLARFDDTESAQPALIAKHYGRGLVIACSGIPYLNAVTYEKLIGSNVVSLEGQRNFTAMRKALSEHRVERSNFWRYILETALLHRQSLAKTGYPVLANAS